MKFRPQPPPLVFAQVRDKWQEAGALTLKPSVTMLHAMLIIKIRDGSHNINIS